MHRFFLLSMALLLSGCMRNSSETWEDIKTAGRYVGKGVDDLCGKGYESRMLASDEEFLGPYDDDFLPLRDSDLQRSISDPAYPQARGIPGQGGIPSLAQFALPSGDLSSLCHAVHFGTDEHVVKGKEEIENLLRLAKYLAKNPHIYVAIEGHTDERASASYNLALGMRRANFVRSFLVQHGVDLNRLYTVSKGKEEPVALGHAPEDWKVNRRSEFKVFVQ